MIASISYTYAFQVFSFSSLVNCILVNQTNDKIFTTKNKQVYRCI